MKKLYGVATNDADYPVVCPYYTRWTGMLQRCYDKRFQAKNPHYKGCRVCKPWLQFSNFKAWMESQDWEGCELDKDMMGNGKLYSPSKCCFIPRRVNTLLNQGARGSNWQTNRWPCGVTFNRQTGQYKTQLCIDGKQKTLGNYRHPYEAGKHYLEAKTAEVARATVNLDVRVRDAIRTKWAKMAKPMWKSLEREWKNWK